MAGGSREPEGDDETQCQHCGLWFGQEGVLPHERTCDLAGFETRKVPLSDPKARFRAGLDPDGDADDDDGDGDAPVVEDTDSDPEPVETTNGVASDPGATRPDDAPAAAPDGGPSDPPDFSDVHGDSGDETDDSGPECPSCGAGDSYLVPVDVLPDSVLAQGPGEKDVLCLSCSSVGAGGEVETETVDGEEVLRINAFDFDEVAA